MIRWYLFPLIVDPAEGRGPKYLDWGEVPGATGSINVKWSMVDYGFMDTAILVADVSSDQHALAAAQPDIITIPENLDSLISPAALPQVVAALEGLHVPAGWITTAHSYRDVVRRVAHLFLLSQRFSGVSKMKIIQSGYNLDSTIASLPAIVRDKLEEAALSLGYDTSSVAGTWTLRQALVYLADQWGATPVYFGNLGTL